MKISIAERIRIIRESRGYSQEFIASKLHVSQQAYSKMEKQPEKMTLQRLCDLCRVFGVNLVALLEEESQEEEKSPIFRRIHSLNSIYRGI